MCFVVFLASLELISAACAMIIYTDIVSKDELFSDAYPIKLIDDLYYEVEGKVCLLLSFDPSCFTAHRHQQRH